MVLIGNVQMINFGVIWHFVLFFLICSVIGNVGTEH